MYEVQIEHRQKTSQNINTIIVLERRFELQSCGEAYQCWEDSLSKSGKLQAPPDLNFFNRKFDIKSEI